MNSLKWALGLMLAALPATAGAQTIYPLDRAQMLVGARFDMKIEFAGSPAADAVRVTINGEDPAKVLGKAATYSDKEDGLAHGAFWIRDAGIAAPGRYVVEATAGDQRASVTWTVYETPPRKAKNVILFIGDGMTVAHRTAARMLSKGIKQGLYGGELAMDDMPAMALISTSGTDSIVTDSANSMSAYTTGHKSCTNALGVYCALNKSSLDHPKVETIAELVRRKHGLALGIVTNTEIEDATPAGVIAHTRRRADYLDIVRMFYEAGPEVVLGGGTPFFLPLDKGGRRPDNIDYVEKFKSAGYSYASTLTEMRAATDGGARKLLGLFNNTNIDGALDRRILKKGTVPRYPDQPDLVDQTRAALSILSRSEAGFFLMVESGRIDKYAHMLDWERSVYDTIMLDNAVQVAKDYAADRNDTLIIVVPDHAHGTAIIGTYDDDRPGGQLREKLGIYQNAGFPTYGTADSEGYPPAVTASRRLAFVFSATPDHCTTGRPSLEGPFEPVQASADGKSFVANEANCKAGSARIAGNLPFASDQGVHTADDVIATAMGPGSELVRGHMPNVALFRVMASALGLGLGR